jgi:hypothetical protein
LLILLLMVPFLFAGCEESTFVSKKTRLDENWGMAYQAAKENQILNPEAGKNLTPVEGLDGQADENNIEKYRNSFKGKSASQSGSSSTLSEMLKNMTGK